MAAERADREVSELERAKERLTLKHRCVFCSGTMCSVRGQKSDFHLRGGYI